MKIKVNDQVKILSGKERGKTGKVIQVFKDENKLVVEGLHIMKKHVRTRKQGEKGQIIELSAPFSLSNAALLCPKCNQPTRVGFKLDGDKKKRWCKKCQALID